MPSRVGFAVGAEFQDIDGDRGAVQAEEGVQGLGQVQVDCYGVQRRCWLGWVVLEGLEVDVGPGWVAEGEGFWGCGFGCVGALGVGCFLFFGVGLRWVVGGSW